MSALIVAASGSALVEQIGSYAGLASMLGLAVMALLYFSQAREVRRLREWAGREPERAAELAQRVQPDPQRRVVAQPMQPTTPAAQQQQATAALYASVGATPPGGVTPAVPPAGSLPAVQPAGSLARPAATPAAGLLPAPGSVLPPAVPGAPNPVATPGLAAAAAGAAAAPPSADAGSPPVSPVASPAPGAVAPSPTPSPGLTAGTATPTPPSRPSPMSAAPRTAAAQRGASLSAYANGSTGQDTRESAAARPEPLLSGDDGGGLSKGRIAAYAGGGITAVVLAVALVLVLTGGEDTQPPNDFGNTPAQESGGGSSASAAGAGSGSASGSASSSRLTAAERRATKVAVLNGTTQAGLGRNVGDKIEKERFTIASVGTNADQQIPATIVSYTAGNETAAKAVAKLVGVGTSSVQPADANASAAADADVVVTVGLDLSG